MLAAMELNEIPARLRDMKKSQAELARHLNLDASSLSKTIKGTRQLKATELIKIEAFFGEALNSAEVESLSERRSIAPKRIPVFGYPVVDSNPPRIQMGPAHVVDWVDPPTIWSGAGELFFVRLVGDEMEPRYFAGEQAVVHSGLPPARGQDCLIEFNDGSGVVRNYRGTKDGQIFAWQYNPAKPGENEERHLATDVKRLHAIDLPTRILR